MNRLAIFAASAAFSAVAANAAEGPGFERIALEVSHHETALRGAIWYPPGTGGESLRLGENAVFAGVPVREGAAVAAGRHPVVLLSHGLGGRFETFAWLPTGLAERGAVVVAVNHPKSTTWDFDLHQAVDHWTRVQDLQAALDYVLNDARWSRSVDESTIATVGFSYGGWTALSMGGVTGNLDGFVRYCERYEDRASDCRDPARAGIDPRDLDADLWDASYKDERIAAVAAIEPGLLHGLDAGNVTNLVERCPAHWAGRGCRPGPGHGLRTVGRWFFDPAARCNQGSDRPGPPLHRAPPLQAGGPGHPEGGWGRSGL